MQSFVEVDRELNKIKATSGTNDKILLIKEASKSELFLKVLRYALDSRLVFKVSKFPAYKYQGTTNNPTVTIFEHLKYLAKSTGASKADKEKLFRLACTNEETYEVVKRICRKDLRCGVSVKSVNKAIPGLVFYIPYCRCSSEKKIDKITYPAIIQEKADGMFANMIVDANGTIVFRTRDGKKVKQLKKLKKLLSKQLPEESYNRVYTGELLIEVDGKVLDRKTGNGFLNSCIYGLANQDIADKAIFKVWDTLPLNRFEEGAYTAPYMERFNYIKTLTELVNDHKFSLIRSAKVDNKEDADYFYRCMREDGKEGAVLKGRNMLWKDHTSPLAVKMKNIMDVELEITDAYYGDANKKYAKCLGGISCRSACGEIVVNVGTGFADDQRGYSVEDDVINKKFAKETMEWWQSQVGKIAQLECESIIKDKVKATHSLFLPRFIEIREDKNTADTLEGLQTR